MKKQVIDNKLVLRDFTNQVHKYNLIDIIAIIPQNKKICIVTKNGDKDFVDSSFPCDECTDIILFHFEDIFKPFFTMMTDHSIINVDEIKKIKISKKDNREKLIVSYENFKLIIREEPDFNIKIIKKAMSEKIEQIACNN